MILSYDMILENFVRTNKQTHRQTENSKPEATLIPVDRRGERANKVKVIFKKKSIDLAYIVNKHY